MEEKSVITPPEPQIKVRDHSGKWLNSQVFRQEAIQFTLNGYYITDPKGSPEYMDYWDEQLRRCQEGYEVGGVKITQHHYEYLNFTQIELKKNDVDAEEDDLTAEKITACPDFWDGDYDYYWSLEIAKNGLFSKYALATTALEKQSYRMLDADTKVEWKQKVLKRLGLRVTPHPDYLDGGNHMIVGKSRRKGYSYKNAAICTNIYNTVRKSLTIIGAFDKKYLYPKGTMGMASNYMSFLNKNTAWGKARDFVNKQEHKRASFEETIDGVKVESGYLSDVMALTFADNPDAARGKDAKIVLLEEAGVFPNLKSSYAATYAGLTTGKFITGQILIFGTGGDMESGTVDFADMFFNPIEYGLMPFVNQWDANAENGYCGFFHPVYLNMEGYYDLQGNSDIEKAIAYEKGERERILKAATSSNVLQKRVQEYPLCPSEAFLTVSTNDFPIVEIRARYDKIKRDNLHLKVGTPVYLFRESESKKVTARPDLDGFIDPIWTYKPKNMELKGGVVIYEWPINMPPKGLYSIGFDPYRQQSSSAALPSLAAIYVYKGVHKHSPTKNQIVAQYVGRPYSPDDVNRIAELLAILYNTEIMYENEVTHVKDYFTRIKMLHLLAEQPDTVIATAVGNSKVKRVFGCHMNEKLKDAGEKYIKQWLLEVQDYDEDGNPVTNLDNIYDIALLEELMLYNRKGNFDRVMALMMVMFQLAEEGGNDEKDDDEEMSDNQKDWEELIGKQFKKAA